MGRWIEHDNFIQCAAILPGMPAVIGYARVSTEDQNLSLQIAALKEAGCQRIYCEKESAVRRRPVFEEVKHVITRGGDQLIVWRLDRLGRNLVDMILTAEYLHRKDVLLKSLQENIDLATAAGTFMFHILAASAQYERNLISERTKAGLAEARKRGKKIGQPSRVHGSHKIEMLVDAWNPKLTNEQVTQRAGYKSVATLFNHFKGERKRVRQAMLLGVKKFNEIKRSRLREVARQENVLVRELNEIIRQKELA